MSFRGSNRMGIYSGRSGPYAGRRGLYAGPKYASGIFELTLPGLLAWWSPRDASTVTLVGTPTDDVSQIDDKSGNDEHLVQTVEGDRPQYPVTMGDSSGFDCDTNVRHLEQGTISIGSSGSIAAVIAPTVASNLNVLGNGSFPAATDTGVLLQTNGSSQFVAFVSDGTTRSSVTNTTSTFATDGTPSIVQITWDGSNLTLRVDGATASAAATEDPSKVGDFAVGVARASNLAFGFNGAVGDVVACGALTTDQQAALEAHWAGVYGVTI